MTDGTETKFEETTKAATTRATETVIERVPVWRTDVFDEVLGKKVNCWTHHQQNSCLQGVVKASDDLGFKLVTVEGKVHFVSWDAGPLFQVLEF